MKRFVVCMAVLSLLIGGVQQAGALTFFDDFNRPDGPVGNGWTNTTGNAVGNLELLNDEVTSTDALGYAGIFRPLSFTYPLRIQATIKDTIDSEGARSRFESRFFIFNDGSVWSGYGINVGRSSNRFSNSGVGLYDGVGPYDTDHWVDIIGSTFQFEFELDVDFTIFQDGSIVGSITEGINTFDFNFGPRLIQSSGENFSYGHTFRGNAGGSLNPRMDNLSISAEPIPEPTTIFLMSCGLLGLLGIGIRHRRKNK